MSGYQYSEQFFNFVDLSSGRSALAFVSRLNFGLEIHSVLDVGCARGIWLKAWSQRGVEEICGVDGADVSPASLLIPAAKFQATDISRPFRLGRKFDLAQCLEVGEHIDESGASTLVENLIRHADMVLFSAATPGQGGEHHVNEQPLEYWAALFAQFGYQAFDYPRVAVRKAKEIEPWYRFNTVLYANCDAIPRLAPGVMQHAVRAGGRFANRATLGWRVRCLVLRALPEPLIVLLAQWKHRVTLAFVK